MGVGAVQAVSTEGEEMQVELLINSNRSDKKRKMHLIPDKNGMVEIKLGHCDGFGGIEVRFLLEQLEKILRTYGRSCRGITFCFTDRLRFRDKLTYIMLECVIYYLIEHNIQVKVLVPSFRHTISTDGLLYSNFRKYLLNQISPEQYQQRFSMVHEQDHFRRLISAESGSEYISVLMSDLRIFFRVYPWSEEFKRDLAEVVTELADNAREHARNDCLIDIDVSSRPWCKNDNSDEELMGVNLVVMNLGQNSIGTQIKEKITGHQYNEDARYTRVATAYEKHQNYFTELYQDDTFFTIASFQDRISGRAFETESGGTGLTALIKSLEEYADRHYCYVLTRNTGVFLEPEYLQYDSDGFIGFNENNNFPDEPPEDDLIVVSPTYLPGVAYNLAFVVKKENCDDGRNNENEGDRGNGE